MIATDSIAELCSSFAWSQWSALGVRGTNVSGPRYAVDLEALTAFTPALEALEPRLYAEALDWCIQFGTGFVSVSRLRQVLKPFPAEHVARFERFAAIVNHESGTSWPATGLTPSRFVASGKSRAPVLDSPALLQLRARKLIGLTARADVYAALAVASRHSRDVSVTASQLAQLGYTKRNIADVLVDLHAADLLSAQQVRNATHYRLERTRACVDLLAPLPKDAPRWSDRLVLAAALLAVEQSTLHKISTIRSITMRKAIHAHAGQLGAIRERSPADRPGDVTRSVLDWMREWLAP